MYPKHVILSQVKLIAQIKRKLGEERHLVVKHEGSQLLKDCFIGESSTPCG